MINTTTELRFLSAMLWIASFAGTVLTVNWAMDGHYLMAGFTALLVLGFGCILSYIASIRR